MVGSIDLRLRTVLLVAVMFPQIPFYWHKGCSCLAKPCRNVCQLFSFMSNMCVCSHVCTRACAYMFTKGKYNKRTAKCKKSVSYCRRWRRFTPKNASACTWCRPQWTIPETSHRSVWSHMTPSECSSVHIAVHWNLHFYFVQLWVNLLIFWEIRVVVNSRCLYVHCVSVDLYVHFYFNNFVWSKPQKA